MRSLQRLLARHDVVAVVTQPEKPAGRGLMMRATPVSQVARAAGIAVLTPSKLDAAIVRSLEDLQPALLACASYGKIVSRAILQIPTLQAALNVHPSLLPRYRGATPIQTALRDGCETTGVTIFWMVQALDAGDIAGSRPVPVAPADNFKTLHDKLANAGAELLLECVDLLVDGTLPRVPQNENDATYTKPLSKEDQRLDIKQPAPAVVNQIRSLSPKPGAWLPFNEKRLKVLEARVSDYKWEREAQPGALLSAGGRTLVKTEPGSIEAMRVVPEGKSEMSGAQFAQRLLEGR